MSNKTLTPGDEALLKALNNVAKEKLVKYAKSIQIANVKPNPTNNNKARLAENEAKRAAEAAAAAAQSLGVRPPPVGSAVASTTNNAAAQAAKAAANANARQRQINAELSQR